MKKSDIVNVILISILSLLGSYLLISYLIGDFNSHEAKVQVIDPIGHEVASPSPLVFNKEAINPTVTVLIGQDSKTEP